MKTGLIFDMDGTLWDSSENVAFSWTEQLQRCGYLQRKITQAEVCSIMGLTMAKIADILFSDLPKAERFPLLEKCCANENQYLLQHGGTLYPQLEKTLKQLQKTYPLYIVSNCQSGYIEAFLTHYGFSHYFEDIECYGNYGKEKAENIALLAARNHLEKAYYIGDTQGDWEAATQAGCGFIHAAYGFGSIPKDVPKISSFSELPALMQMLCPQGKEPTYDI